MAVYFRLCGDYLLFNQTVASNPRQFNASNLLQFVQAIKVSPLKLQVSNAVHLSQRLTYRHSIVNLTVSHSIHFEDKAQKVFELAIFQNLFFIQSTRTVDYFAVTDNLSLQQTLDGYKTKPVNSQVEFTQTVSNTIKRNPLISSTINFVSSAYCYMIKCNFYAIPLPTLNNETLPIQSDCS